MKGKTKIAEIILEVIMLLVCVVFVYPFYYMVINTFKTSQESAFYPLSLPRKFDVSNYVYIFQNSPVARAFLNSTIITLASVLLIVMFGAMAAYTISFRKNRLNTFLKYFLIAGFMIPMQSTLIPLFQLMTKLKLIDSITGIIIFYTQGCVFAFFLYQGFMKTFPKELVEAANIDGCGPGRTFSAIVFPLLKPITVTVAIYHIMWIWNDFLFANQFLNSRKNSTLVLEIFQAKGQFSTNWSNFMAMLVIVMVPMFILYVFMQKSIMKGLMGGALKG